MPRTLLLATPLLAALLAQLATYYPRLATMNYRTVASLTKLSQAEQLTNQALQAVPSPVVQRLPQALWQQYVRLLRPATPGKPWKQRLAWLQETRQLLAQLAELPVAE